MLSLFFLAPCDAPGFASAMTSVLAVGVSHSLVLSDKGHVFSFGSSEFGQLGRDIVGGNYQYPGRIVGSRENDGGDFYFSQKRIVAIDSGDYHCAALGVDGSLYTWGDASDGKLGHGEEAMNEAGNHDKRRSHSMPCIVHHFMHVNTITKEITGIKVKIQNVSCGCSHTLCIDDTGESWSWGHGQYGQLGHGDTRNCHFPKRIADLKKIKLVQVSAGAKHSLAVSAKDGHLYSWGHGDHGRLGTGEYVGSPRPVELHFPEMQTSIFYRVSAGETHSAALTIGGEAFTWGCGNFGKLGHQMNDDVLSPKLVEALSGTPVGYIQCAPFHTVFVTKILKGDASGGLIYTCGSDQYGRLGNGGDSKYDDGDNLDLDDDVGSESVPLPCDGPISAHRISCVAAGAFHNIGCSLDGTIWGWGFSGSGRLSIEEYTSIQQPLTLAALRQISVTGRSMLDTQSESEQYLDIIRNGVSRTQNRLVAKKLSSKKKIKLTPGNLCKTYHKNHPFAFSSLNHYRQVKGIFQSFSYSTLRAKDIIRSVDLGSTVAVSAKKLKDGDPSKHDSGDEDEEEGFSLQPLPFNTILNSLVYEFRGHSGAFNVIAIYNKYYIIDELDFTVAEVFEKQRLGNLIFKTSGSISTFNMEEFLRLIEDIVMKCLLL